MPRRRTVKLANTGRKFAQVKGNRNSPKTSKNMDNSPQCTVCNVNLMNEKNRFTHNQGRKHLNNLRRQKVKERKRKLQKNSPSFLSDSGHNVFVENDHIAVEVGVEMPTEDTIGDSSKQKENSKSKSPKNSDSCQQDCSRNDATPIVRNFQNRNSRNRFERENKKAGYTNSGSKSKEETENNNKLEKPNKISHHDSSQSRREIKKAEDTNDGSYKWKEKSDNKSKFEKANNLSDPHRRSSSRNSSNSDVHSLNRSGSENRKTEDGKSGSSKPKEKPDNEKSFEKSKNRFDSHPRNSSRSDSNPEIHSRNRKYYDNDYYRNDISDFNRPHSSHHPNPYRWNNMSYPNQTPHYGLDNFRNHDWGPWQQSHREQSMYDKRNIIHPPLNEHFTDRPDEFESVEIQMRRQHHPRWDEDYVQDDNHFVSENIQPEMSENIPDIDGSSNYPISNSSVVENSLVDQETVPKERSTTVSNKTVPNKVQPKQSTRKRKVICGIAKTAIKRTSIDKETVGGKQTDSDSDKQQDKRNVLSENMTGKRIAHWIKPSNQKDAAEVRRLVTEFSKSKKKENLLRLKLQQSVSEPSDDKSNENNKICEDSSVITTSIPQSEISEANKMAFGLLFPTQKLPELPLCADTIATPKTYQQKRGKSSTSKSLSESKSPNSELLSSKPPVSNSSAKSPAKKPRHRTLNRTVHSVKEVAVQVMTPTENTSSVTSTKKRKDSVEKVNSNFKKQRHMCSSAECLEACIEATIQACNVPQLCVTSESKELPSQSVIHKESTSQEKIPGIKQELSEAFDEVAAQNFLKSINIEDLLQNQAKLESSGTEEATMTPVESLINLFATGDVKIKKEFDDPLIDVIRTVDPALLHKVCDAYPTTNEDARSNEPQLPVISAVHSVTPSQTPANPIPSLTGSLKNILNELQSISTMEEKVKKDLEQADKKIQEYQALLDEWKTQKIKFQSEEEILRKQRNGLVKSMNDLVTQQNGVYPSPESVENGDCSSAPTTSSPVVDCGGVFVKKEIVDDDEISILPFPEKPSENKFPVIEISEAEARDKVYKERMDQEAHLERFCVQKYLQAHDTVINTIQIFEDHLYSCSNDFTAKRFYLKDPTISVTYKVNAKNITHMCIEKVREKTIVFVSCATLKTVTAFDAELGTVLQVFNLRSTVACICSNRGKIYAGLRNGSIMVLNGRVCSGIFFLEHKELVNTNELIRSIASNNQGGLNMLVILSTRGNVSMRDVDRSGLLIRCVKSRTHVPLFMHVHSDLIYLSSSGVLTVLDVSTGKFVRKYELSAAYTNLAVSGNNIFTTSFSGLVRCYSKDEVKDVKLYYGAGKSSLTCIHVYQGWVFTGNRRGQIAAFKFDPDSGIPCQFEKCEFLFPRLEDLLHHTLGAQDHTLPTTGALCTWRNCRLIIPPNWDAEAINCHIREHLTGLSLPQLHHQLYNFCS